MTSSADPYSILNKKSGVAPLRPKYDPSHRVERYRPGVIPKWATETEEQVSQAKINRPGKLIVDQIQPSAIQPEEPRSDQQDIAKFYTVDEDSSSDDLMSEEYESDSETIKPPLLKPIFVPPDKRITHIVREQEEQEQNQIMAQLQQINLQKVEQTKSLIQEILQREEQQSQYEEEVDIQEQNDDPEEEFKKWKLREIQRILRDKDEREQRHKELAEIERRRTLTDWERREEDRLLGNDESAKPKQRKILYMQKSYIKPAFYQQRNENGELHPLYMRDFNAPVEGDYDKSYLPSYLQKRRGDIGRKGQSKWTHLTAEDTMEFDPKYAPNPDLALKQQLKQGGYKGVNSM